MFLPNYPFGCHSNQSNLAFWTKCVYSVEDYSNNMSMKRLSTYMQRVRNKGLLSFFPVRWVISLLLIYIICPGLLLHFCLVISGLCLGITTPEMTFTISSSSCIGIINIYFIRYFRGGWYNFSCIKSITLFMTHLDGKNIMNIIIKKKCLAQKNKIVGDRSRIHGRLIRNPTR